MAYPFTNFNFSVEINVKGVGSKLCNAEFSDCDGLDLTLDLKTIREGGNNTQQIRLLGPVNYGTVTLKRGMTDSFDLWDWFDAQQQGTASQLRNDLRGDAEIVIMSADQQTERVRYLLSKCLLAKLKAPTLNAKDGAIAIEEMQLVFESMTVKRPGGAA